MVTFLPAFVGAWGFLAYPVGWLFLPGYFAASKQLEKQAELNRDRQDAALKMQELVSNFVRERKQ